MLVGHWQGNIYILASEIPVSVDFNIEDGVLTGALDIASRQIEDLALTAELAPNGTIQFAISDAEPAISFVGELEGNVITGSFRQGIFRGAFSLERTTPEG